MHAVSRKTFAELIATVCIYAHAHLFLECNKFIFYIVVYNCVAILTAVCKYIIIYVQIFAASYIASYTLYYS